MPLAFIIPTACYLKLSKVKWCSPTKIVALLVMLFGLMVLVIGTVLAIMEVSCFVLNLHKLMPPPLLLQAVESYSNKPEPYKQPYYCPGSNLNATCCQLFNTTSNFTLHIPLCNCRRLCPDPDLLPSLSEDFCVNFTIPD